MTNNHPNRSKTLKVNSMQTAIKPLSKLPWKYESNDADGLVIDSNNLVVCNNKNYYPQAVLMQDMQFIVRACNAHDDLVAALNDLVSTFNPDEQALYNFARPKIEAARAALAKAGKS